MNTEQFKEEMKKQTYIVANSEMHLHMHEMAQRALKITAQINDGYRTPDELRKLFSELIGQEVDAVSIPLIRSPRSYPCRYRW